MQLHKKGRVFLAGAAFFLLAALTGRLAAAQGIDPLKIKEMPHFTGLSDADFLAQTDLHDESVEGDKYLDYSLRLPKGWTKESDIHDDADNAAQGDSHLSRHIMGRVTTYFGPTAFDGISRLEIKALELNFDVSARNWFLNYIVSSGFTLEGMEQVSPVRLEALYVLIDRGVSYEVRTVAQINGTRIVLASYYLPEVHWNKERDKQEKVLESFKFTNPEKARVEPVHTYSFLDLLRFDYPASWRLVAPTINSVESMDASLVNSQDDKIQNGQIGIHVLATDADTTLAQEVAALRDGLKNSGLVVGSLIEVPQGYKFHTQVVFNRVEVYSTKSVRGDAQVQDQEYWLAIMAEDRYYYVVTMLTPGRDINFLNWARNTEAFKTVIETLRL